MDTMKMNEIWDFVEQAEALFDGVKDEVYLNEENEDEDEVATLIMQVEGAISDLDCFLWSLVLEKQRSG